MIKRIGQILYLVAALVASSALAQPTTAPATEPSGYQARREVGIHGPDEDERATQQWAWELKLQALKLAPEYLGISGATADRDIQIDGSNPWPQGLTVSINIDVEPQTSPGANPNAPAFADELIARLETMVKEKDVEARQSEIHPIEKNIEESQSRLENARQELTTLRNQLRRETGRIDVSAAKLKEAALKLDDQHQDLELAKLGKQARVKAIQNAIARLSKQVEQKVKNDPIAAELKKVVEGREAQLDRVKNLVQQHAAATGELQEKAGIVAEAQAKLLERQRDAASEAGGGQIDSLNQELTTLNIDLAEIDAKLTALNQEKDGLQWALDHVDQFTHLTAVLADEQKNLDDARQKLRKTKDRLDRTPPVTIRVIRSSNG